MRLTLRTLLAWLDDTLSPAEVRDIGQQVADSPFAKELVERIQRVTRQRRLTVPKDTGDDASDPNLVAAYLDNTLDPDAVTEFEKLCLTSDVHLAEVASAHQILSLIGQKAKVPAEARHRMTHLVKGREAAQESSAAAPASASARPRPRPVTNGPPQEPSQASLAASWAGTDFVRRPWLERFGPGLTVVGLIALLGLSAWKSLGPRAQPGHPTLVAHAVEPAPPAPPPALVPVAPPPPKAEEPQLAAAPAPIDEPKEPEKPEKPAPLPPEQGVGTIGKAEAVALRYNVADRHWEIAPAEAPVKADDRIVGLAPFRLPLRLGTAKVELIRATEIRPRAADADLAARFELTRGRVVLHAEDADKPVGVALGAVTLKVSAPAEVPIGLERADRPGKADEEPSPTLHIYVPEGKVTLAAGTTSETVTGPATLQFRAPDAFEKLSEPAPPWVAETEPSPADKRAGAEFAGLFAKGGFPKTILVQATLDDQEKEVRHLALEGLGSIGEIDVVLEALNSPGDPSIRLAAIEVLRAALAQSAESAADVHDSLQDFCRDVAQAAVVEKLLVGYTPKEGRDPKTYEALVANLEAPELGTRELALVNLRALTGRDRLDYNPDKPEDGPGLQAWRDLLKAGKLVPPPAGRGR